MAPLPTPNYEGFQSYDPDAPDPTEEGNYAQIEPGTKWQYDCQTKNWTAESIWAQLDPQPFTEGSMRMVFHLKDYSLPEAEQKVIAKMSKNPSETRDVYFLEVEMQAACQAFADEFNKHDPPKTVQFVKPYLIEFHHRRGGCGFGNLIMGVEEILTGQYKKYSNNYGFVSPEHRNTPQCFSHWTYKFTQGKMLVCDLQGVGDLYTDPQIHSLPLQFGQADLGSEGMQQFFNTHTCNALCDFMGLSAKSHGHCSHCLKVKEKIVRDKKREKDKQRRKEKLRERQAGNLIINIDNIKPGRHASSGYGAKNTKSQQGTGRRKTQQGTSAYSRKNSRSYGEKQNSSTSGSPRQQQGNTAPPPASPPPPATPTVGEYNAITPLTYNPASTTQFQTATTGTSPTPLDRANRNSSPTDGSSPVTYQTRPSDWNRLVIDTNACSPQRLTDTTKQYAHTTLQENIQSVCKASGEIIESGVMLPVKQSPTEFCLSEENLAAPSPSGNPTPINLTPLAFKGLHSLNISVPCSPPPPPGVIPRMPPATPETPTGLDLTNKSFVRVVDGW